MLMCITLKLTYVSIASVGGENIPCHEQVKFEVKIQCLRKSYKYLLAVYWDLISSTISLWLGDTRLNGYHMILHTENKFKYFSRLD